MSQAKAVNELSKGCELVKQMTPQKCSNHHKKSVNERDFNQNGNLYLMQ